MTTSTDPQSPVPEAQTPRRTGAMRTIAALILREMSTRYGRTPGGYAWALLEPLGMIVILSFGFSLLLRSPSLGTSFLLFYATGFLPFNLYQGVSLNTSRALTYSRPLLAYPAVTWIDAVLARFLLTVLTAVTVAAVLMVGILSIIDARVVIQLGPILGAMGLGAVFGLGVGVLNCLLTGLFPTWAIVWSIITRPLFIVSGVIYIYEDLPRAAQNVIWYNPLIHITAMMRSGFYPMYEPDWVSPEFVVFSALIPMAAGLLLLRRHYKDILNA
ncbi:ABC transporter permease [Tranquillimonas rosea]|uniref:ABC transporter permease n=1 Tax=Tranquillimonas rosea TaxID=641238 RepID=UPI001F3E9FEF|nr:ABC transporter permease [Tranquillimonas rosea]